MLKRVFLAVMLFAFVFASDAGAEQPFSRVLGVSETKAIDQIFRGLGNFQSFNSNLKLQLQALPEVAFERHLSVYRQHLLAYRQALILEQRSGKSAETSARLMAAADAVLDAQKALNEEAKAFSEGRISQQELEALIEQKCGETQFDPAPLAGSISKLLPSRNRAELTVNWSFPKVPPSPSRRRVLSEQYYTDVANLRFPFEMSLGLFQLFQHLSEKEIKGLIARLEKWKSKIPPDAGGNEGVDRIFTFTDLAYLPDSSKSELLGILGGAGFKLSIDVIYNPVRASERIIPELPKKVPYADWQDEAVKEELNWVPEEELFFAVSNSIMSWYEKGNTAVRIDALLRLRRLALRFNRIKLKAGLRLANALSGRGNILRHLIKAVEAQKSQSVSEDSPPLIAAIIDSYVYESKAYAAILLDLRNLMIELGGQKSVPEELEDAIAELG